MRTRTLKIVSILAAVASFAGATLADAQTYDATTSFSVVSNPNGVWSYGYSPLGGSSYAMTVFNQVIDGALWLDSSYDTLSTPSIWKNLGSGTTDGVAPGQISLNPGPVAGGDFAILRFTAPTAGTYGVTGQFYAGDSGSMSGYIVLAGNMSSPLESFSNTTDTSIFTPLSLSMTSGETLDFVVGNGGGSFFFGNTPLIATINAAVPEPETYALMLAGLGLLGFAARRSKLAA
jgi:hypothetical protein